MRDYSFLDGLFWIVMFILATVCVVYGVHAILICSTDIIKEVIGVL